MIHKSNHGPSFVRLAIFIRGQINFDSTLIEDFFSIFLHAYFVNLKLLEN